MGGILLVTAAGTLRGMYLYGIDMQRISLDGLIIALGMQLIMPLLWSRARLCLSKRVPPAAVSSAVVEQTNWPLLSGAIVGFLAFSPAGFSPDSTGEYA